MAAYIDRVNATPVINAVAFPLILCFALAVLTMAWAAWRAGLIGWWGPAVVAPPWSYSTSCCPTRPAPSTWSAWSY
jgi:hypothetical protein